MRSKFEEKNTAFLVAFLLVGGSFVPSVIGINGISNQERENIIIIVQNNNDITKINYHINQFTSKKIIIDGNEYLKITLNDESNIMIKGKPELPNICRSIIIPDNLKMIVRVIQSEYREYNNINIIPSKGHLLRTVNPNDIPYEFDKIYNENKWFPESIAKLRDPYIVRDFRGQVVEIYPFQYNPIEEKMRFYTDITIEIYPDGLSLINSIDRDEMPLKINTDFRQIYARHFINSDKIFNNGYKPVEEEGKMLVITYDDFWDAMIPFVQWKNMKGIPTKMVNVSTIGDANAIKTYIEYHYNNFGLTFVLLVGDEEYVPTILINSTASDPSYSYVAGEDHYPDLFVGRFSAQNLSQLETQIDRSLEYERDPQIDAEWYQKGMGVASSQGPGDDGEKDYEHIRNIRSKLLNYTYIEVDELYDGTQGGKDNPGNPTSTMVADALNDGRSITNYCGHGYYGGWSSSGFNIYKINSLVNDNMLPYIISVACNVGQFDDYNACFCEALLRATHDGEPTGAIVATGSSKSMSWSPPMDGQDEMNDLVVESYIDNIKHTFGGIHVNGCIHMNIEYGSYGESETDTWHIFGDPSLQIRTTKPTEMTIYHNPIIEVGTAAFIVYVPWVRDALCTISNNYKILGYAYTDVNGYAEINFYTPISSEYVDLVVTGYNKIPYNTSLPVGDNYPPYAPTITGPTTGKPGKEYKYSAITTDPEEDKIFYKFDWGDGTSSEWLGSFNSGQETAAFHAWSEEGNFSVKVRAKDVNDTIGYWSELFPVQIELPVLSIDHIKGGIFKITSTIKNTGIAEADDINWKISLEGGFLLLGNETSGKIDTISGGDEKIIISEPIIGFGLTRVFVQVNIPEESKEISRNAIIFLFFIVV